MRIRSCRSVLTWIAVCMAALAARGAEPTSAPPQTPQTFTVSETYNKTPFDYQMKLLAQRNGFRVYRLTYPSPVVTPVEQNNTIRADYYLPDNIKPGSSKRPAVITLHVLNGDMRPTDVACSVLAMRGIPAVMPTLPYYGERAKAEGWEVLLREPKLFLAMLLQSIEDTRRTADLLASRPEVNPQRINLSGASLVGIVAATIAGPDPRFYRTSLFLAGGDLLKILHHARYTRGLSERFRQLPTQERTDLESRVEAVDPLRLAPALRERAQDGRVLMVNAAEDEIIPRDCTERLAAALGIADRVVWLHGLQHETFISALPQSLRAITDFFAQDLPADVSPNRPTTTEGSTPLCLAAALIHQSRAMLETEPTRPLPGEMDITPGLRPKSSKPCAASARATDQFAIKCRLPVVGEVAIGQRESPGWSRPARALMGVNPGQGRNPLKFANPRAVKPASDGSARLLRPRARPARPMARRRRWQRPTTTAVRIGEGEIPGTVRCPSRTARCPRRRSACLASPVKLSFAAGR